MWDAANRKPVLTQALRSRTPSCNLANIGLELGREILCKLMSRYQTNLASSDQPTWPRDTIGCKVHLGWGLFWVCLPRFSGIFWKEKKKVCSGIFSRLLFYCGFGFLWHSDNHIRARKWRESPTERRIALISPCPILCFRNDEVNEDQTKAASFFAEIACTNNACFFRNHLSPSFLSLKAAV